MAKRVSGNAEYIIPLAVVGAIAFGLWKLFGGSGGSGGGGGGGLVESAEVSLGLKTSSAATQQQTLSLMDQIAVIENNIPDNQNPLGSDMYNANTDCPSIDEQTARSMWSTIYTASDPGIFFSNPDMTGVLDSFKLFATNRCDISWVASLCDDQTGTDFETWIMHQFGNDSTGRSGKTQMQMLYDFITWAVKLPMP